MTQSCSYQLAGQVGVNPSPAGVEVPNSRRLIYIADAQYARVSYAGGGLGDAAVGVFATADGGSTWSPFVPYGPTLNVAAGTVLASAWTDLLDAPWAGDVMVAAFVAGSALSLGLLYQLAYVELQVR